MDVGSMSPETVIYYVVENVGGFFSQAVSWVSSIINFVIQHPALMILVFAMAFM